MKRRIILAILLIFFIGVLKADTTEFNPGGNQQGGLTSYGGSQAPTTCTPFFTCSGLGYTCGLWNNGCGGVICGSCADGDTCTSGTCVAPGVYTTPTPTPTPTPSGGGLSLPINITIGISPKEFNIRMAINTNQLETIRITNFGNTTKIFDISQKGLDNKIIISNTFLTINPGESKNVNVIFVAPSTEGIYNGSILVGNIEIPVILNVKIKNLLFDSNILVLNKGYKVSLDGTLKTKVTLVPMGDKERLDVQLNYVIKDSFGKTYITQTETVLVENKINFFKNFDISGLPLGKYTVELKLVYPGGVAPSSSNFEIVEKTVTDFISESVFNLLVLILLISVIIIFAIIRRVNQTGIETEQVIL